MNPFKTLLLLIFLLMGLSLAAQSAAELKRKRQRLITSLQQTTQQLDATKAQRSAAMNRLHLLEQQIVQRRELMATLDQEIALTDSRIATNQDVIHSLNLDLDRMRQEYAETLRSAYRNQRTSGWLAFVFSASNFNDAFRRIQYIRQYQDYRRRQGRLIHETQAAISLKTTDLAEQKSEKERLLLAAQEQGNELEKALASQTTLVDDLTGTEKRLLVKIQQQQREQRALDKSIEAAIVAEIKARNARKATTAAGTTNDATVAAGTSFANNRGRLPWPAQGDITKGFGSQPHPDVPSVTIYNGGIDLEAGSNARVQCVFEGEVISSRLIPGYRNTIMIRHGDFYTVYSNLDRVIVQVGESIELGATIGFTSANGDPLHFEIWQGKNRQDPEKWLN
ncbi:MAG: peptidoglycan DD-metalloendopeptidase family protein [Bacteroidota bacterium]